MPSPNNDDPDRIPIWAWVLIVLLVMHILLDAVMHF